MKLIIKNRKTFLAALLVFLMLAGGGPGASAAPEEAAKEDDIAVTQEDSSADDTAESGGAFAEPGGNTDPSSDVPDEEAGNTGDESIDTGSGEIEQSPEEALPSDVEDSYQDESKGAGGDDAGKEEPAPSETESWPDDTSSEAGGLITADMIVTTGSVTYTGALCTPKVTVSDGDIILTDGVDYTLQYANNINVGTARVTVTGKDNYTGSAERTFKINPKPITSAMILSIGKQLYTGKAICPAVTVKHGGKTLKKGTDYTVTYSNNTKAGTAKVTVTGKGNYKGSAVKSFLICRPAVTYNAHVQNIGWQKYVKDGASAGTSGRSLRLEALHIKIADSPFSGDIRYRTHIQNIGCESGWKENGALSGTTGRSLRVEAVQISLTGDLAKKYDIYYRVHCQDFGWLDWAKNGASAGSAGFSKRMEAIQILLVKKGGKAPGSTTFSFCAKETLIASLGAKKGTDQILFFNAGGGTSADVELWEKKSGKWSRTRSTKGYVGRSGVGSGSAYADRTPFGAWQVDFAFGIHDNPGCCLPYRKIGWKSYWVGGVDDPLYDTWVESSYRRNPDDEHLADYPTAYEYAVAIKYRAGYAKGAAFFLHVSAGRPTGGCMVVPRNEMIWLIRNLKPGSYICNINSFEDLRKL